LATTDTATEIEEQGEASVPDVTIALDPHRPGVERARLVQYEIPVWALIGYMGGEDGAVSQTAADYGIPEAAVRAALAYYRAHREAIDALLATQRAATVSRA
jgi:uncharacterized protein (DUF433 family)